MARKLMDAITKNKISKLLAGSRVNKLIAVLVVLSIAGAGYLLTTGGAAGFFAASEADSGTFTANAKLISDSSASGGKAIQFTAPATPPPPPPPPPPPSGNQTNCINDPSVCGYPDADNTGPSGTLTLMNLSQGYMEITTPGTVIENKDIRGCLIIKAANVTVRNSKVSCPNYSVIYSTRDYYSGGGLLLENVEITCHDSSGNPTQGTGISEYGFTARNIEIYDCENGLSITDGVTLENSYIHNLYEGPNGDGHADGVQMAGSTDNIVIRHNTFNTVGATSSVNWTGMASDVLIDNNLMGGGAFVVYCPRVTIPSGAYRVTNNRFADQLPAFGLSDSCAGGDVTWTGNYKDSNLAAVSAQ